MAKARWLKEVACRLLEHLPPAGGPDWTVLTYHQVVPDGGSDGSAFDELKVRRGCFAATLDWLRDNAEVVSLDRGNDWLADPVPLKRPLVSITFDDGYRNNLTVAAPELAARRLPATLFLTTATLAPGFLFWWDAIDAWTRFRGQPFHPLLRHIKALPHQRRLEATAELAAGIPAGHLPHPYLTADDLGRLAEAGIALGNHTATHAVLDEASESVCAEEVGAAHRRLVELTGIAPRHFAYPEGRVNAVCDPALRRLDYVCAYTAERGRNGPGSPPYRLRRLDASLLQPWGGFSPHRARYWILSGGIPPGRPRAT